MFESVYVCRDTGQYSNIVIAPAHIGIVKLEGCYMFRCAIKDTNGDYGNIYDGEKEDWTIRAERCREKYSSVPKNGEAWLVEEGRKYINWTRVDLDMHLLNADGSIVKK